MKNTIPWERRRFERLELGLDQAAPLNATVHRYERTRRLVSDMHYGLELGIVCEGQIVREYQSHRRILNAGEAWICGMWEPHGGRIRTTPCKLLVFTALPETLRSMRFVEAPAINLMQPFLSRPSERPAPSMPVRRKLLQWSRRVERMLDTHPGPVRQVRMRLLLIEGLLMLLEDWRPRGATPPRPSDDPSGISKAVNLVLDSKKTVSADQAARVCAISRSRFDRLFNQYMGLTFGKFALRHRLHGVASDLLGSDAPLKSIAHLWGFVDVSHLHHRFREIYDCSPSAYRTRHVTAITKPHRR